MVNAQRFFSLEVNKQHAIDESLAADPAADEPPVPASYQIQQLMNRPYLIQQLIVKHPFPWPQLCQQHERPLPFFHILRVVEQLNFQMFLPFETYAPLATSLHAPFATHRQALFATSHHHFVLTRIRTKWGWKVVRRAVRKLFSAQELSMFPAEIPCSACPHFELLGFPIERAEYCAQYIESKRKDALHLLSLLPQLCNPQVAVTIPRPCASFCKLAHLARQHLLHQCQSQCLAQ